ncbi:hypothetical protein Aph01nite_62590 [Acrocarpospora phusangensis]|uniref:TIR domain-containing protein n=1 Tax=Acrocarpospora phusangensis TaxID=1070424 RepID=A0A919UNI3_9ACTN|nr:FxsC protein [Acrocarpospora phusangensis]GIH27949.1 hypothetical protein Aph01nite_62590 [Acrocarpospora phusangensis]
MIRTDPRPFFFISHSTVDPSVLFRVSRDLTSRVAQVIRSTQEAARGFIEFSTDDHADTASLQAVSACRVLVPLLSPRYLEDRRCAMEWGVFNRRLNDLPVRTAPPIVPAMWVPIWPSEIPEEILEVPFDPLDVGGAYAEFGLYGLATMTQYKKDYRNAIDNLGERIGAASRIDLPVGADQPTGLPSSFSRSPDRTPFRIFVAAWTAETAPPGVDYGQYGESPLNWAPYADQSAKPIGESTAQIVENLRYEAQVISFEDSLDQIMAEESPAGPGILLLDPAMLSDPEMAGKLKRLDALPRPWIRLVIPLPSRGAGASDSVVALGRCIEEVFPQRSREQRARVQEALTGIRDIADFEVILTALIDIAGRQYLKARSQASGQPQRERFERPPLFGSAHDDGGSSGRP